MHGQGEARKVMSKEDSWSKGGESVLFLEEGTFRKIEVNYAISCKMFN